MARTVYLYVDESGVAHAVSDQKAVPKKFRQKAKSISVPDQPAFQWRAPDMPAAGSALQALVPLIVGYLLWRWITGFIGRLALVVAAGFLAYSLVFDRLIPKGLMKAGGSGSSLPRADVSRALSEIDLRKLGVDPKLLEGLKKEVELPKAGGE